MMTKENKAELHEYISDYYKEKERQKIKASKPKTSKAERLKKAEAIRAKHQKEGGG